MPLNPISFQDIVACPRGLLGPLWWLGEEEVGDFRGLAISLCARRSALASLPCCWGEHRGAAFMLRSTVVVGVLIYM